MQLASGMLGNKENLTTLVVSRKSVGFFLKKILYLASFVTSRIHNAYIKAVKLDFIVLEMKSFKMILVFKN